MSARGLREIELAPVACCTPVAEPDITPGQAATLAAVFKALADPHRVRIVNLLANSPEPLCVCEFTPQLGLDGRAQVGVGIAGLLSVGIRGALNLVTVGVPVTNELVTTIKNIEKFDAVPSLAFTTKIGLSLATLSGWLSLYLEFLFIEEEFEILRWNGISTVIDLMPPVTANLRIGGMKG